MEYVPNLNTWADLVDRLIVCVNKLAWFENQKRTVQAELDKLGRNGLVSPRYNELALLVAHWDNLSRNECEVRNILKREIDRVLGEVVAAGEYKTLPDNRTFRAPNKTVADILAEQCSEIGKSTFEKLNGG
jgi:hypothetical protein